MGSSPIESNTKTWTVNDREIAFNLQKPTSAKGRTSELKWLVNIPKLMPMIPVAEPKETKHSLDKTIFCNAKECMPTIKKQITTINYLTANRPPNRAFKFALKSHGMKMEVELPFRNMDDRRIDNTIDNSEPD